ncbi:hypothetical protein [Hyphomicrobium sp.]|uniref:hypothetical protein n=1 Tax=Hyphomicrobium sp. TaxID=82 RepID=UPI002FE26CF7
MSITANRISGTRIIVGASAATLVVASAGFGAFYAWTTGNHHGPVLGALSVLMALGLEGAKPLAIEGVFAALRSWSLGRAIAMAALGLVAVAYSLTAELSLMASIRADNAAARTLAGDTAAAARARYNDAKAELAALPAARPAGTVAAEIERLRTTPGLVSCDDTTAKGYGPITRRVCAEIATLRAEGETASQREHLRQALAAAEHDMATTPPTTKSDPAASALATYLAVFGISVAVASLSDWLALMPVLALEIGSALALVLVNGTRLGTGAPKHGTQGTAEASQGRPTGVPSVSKGVSEGAAKDPPESDTVGSAQEPRNAPLRAALLTHLRDAGGSLRTGQRALAKTLGASTTELHRTLHALAATGVIALNAAPTGTELRLVA